MAEEDKDEGLEISSRTLELLLLGITLVFSGIVVIIVASVAFGGSGSVGGVILIGPIPIVFGAGPESGFLIAIGVVITIISIVSFWVLNKRIKRNSD